MVERVIIYVLLTLLALAGGYGVYSKYKVKSLREEVIHLENENIRLEQLLKVRPFEAVVIDRKERANDEINSTLSNDDFPINGTFRL